MKKLIGVGCLLFSYLICHAETPIFTIYNSDIDDSHLAAEIKVKIFTMDGEECYSNDKISQYRYRTQIMPSELKCQKDGGNSQQISVFVDYAYYTRGVYRFHGSPNPTWGGSCVVRNQGDRVTLKVSCYK